MWLRPLHTSARRLFQLPPTYKPNSRVVKELPFSQRVHIWWNSLHPRRLEQLQHQLVELLFPTDSEENRNVKRTFQRVPIDQQGNVLNEVTFEVVNDPAYATKHVVFLHGYGASLGCFARNFHVVNRFKGLRNNYTVHFVDNVSFALSLNPKIPLLNYWRPIPKVDHVSVHDSRPTDPTKLYNKYYKLVDGFDVDPAKAEAHRDKMVPVLKDMEAYYTGALEGWRRASNIPAIDFLVGHSFGGYWAGSYAVTHPGCVRNLVLLSPVGVERTAFAVTAPVPDPSEDVRPSLDPTSYRFLSRWPILSRKTIRFWYHIQPYLPRLLRFMGPFGVSKYYDMWYSKLFAINKVIEKLGGKTVFSSANELRYGTNTECRLLIEYLYNSITSGTRSDTHVKYLLTPATVSRWPLFDKFAAAQRSVLEKLNVHVVYGQYDFMNAEAGEKLVKHLQDEGYSAQFHTVAQGGHNLYIQNPFGTNKLLETIVKDEDAATESAPADSVAAKSAPTEKSATSLASVSVDLT